MRPASQSMRCGIELPVHSGLGREPTRAPGLRLHRKFVADAKPAWGRSGLESFHAVAGDMSPRARR